MGVASVGGAAGFAKVKALGGALVLAFEEQVRQRGGLTILLGSDDQDDMTSLAGVDLYENLWDKVKNIQNFKGHLGSIKRWVMSLQVWCPMRTDEASRIL